jgi:hypothetical protein
LSIVHDPLRFHPCFLSNNGQLSQRLCKKLEGNPDSPAIIKIIRTAVDSDAKTTSNIIVNIGYALSTEQGLALDDLMNGAVKSVISAKELGRSYVLKLVD